MKTTYTRRSAMNLDAAMASHHAVEIDRQYRQAGQAPPGASTRETASMAESGIDYDGRSYWYRQYRYDRIQDALAYAGLDQSRPDTEPELAGQRRWQEPEPPSAATRQLMAELGITYDGRYYRYEDYRYDQFVDAINYAQSTNARTAGATTG